MLPVGWALAKLTDLQLGSDGAVWAATEGGLSRVKDGHITTLTSKDGLPCDAVQGVMKTTIIPSGCTWLAAWCGLRVPNWTPG